jgi:DNA polymerase-3 subunit alpha
LRLLDFDHWRFTKELWDYHQQNLSQINHKALIALQRQGLFIAIPKDDPATFTALRIGKIESLLLESKLAHWMMAQLQPNSFNDLMVLVSFLRLPYFYTHYSAFQVLVERKTKQTELSPWPESIQTLLKDTYGFPLYIEQVAEIIMALTGYPLERCYSLLQRLKRKQVDFGQDVEEFLEAVQKHGGGREVAWGLFALCVEFAPDAAYRSSLESYVTPVYESAYLQTHHSEAYQAVKEELKHAKTKP